MTYTKIAQAEIRNTDRRVAQNTPNIFYKVRKCQIKHVTGKSGVSFNQRKGKNVKAKAVFTDEQMKSLLSVHQGTGIFRDFRLSPPYLQNAKKKAFAMIRQEGTPTFFQSFSIADTK